MLTKLAQGEPQAVASRWHGVGGNITEPAPLSVPAGWKLMPVEATAAIVSGEVKLTSNGFEVKTDEGTMTGVGGDYLIRGVEGELYPCRLSVFAAAMREQVEGEAITWLRRQSDYCAPGSNRALAFNDAANGIISGDHRPSAK